MAHFAKIGERNREGIVEEVLVVSNDVATSESAGANFLNNLYGTSDTWKQTSYNTRGGIHQFGGTPLRKNHAGKGYTYDETRDAFIAPKPYSSWTLNEDTCQWEAPVAYPDDDKPYEWNEETQAWEEIVLE